MAKNTQGRPQQRVGRRRQGTAGAVREDSRGNPPFLQELKDASNAAVVKKVPLLLLIFCHGLEKARSRFTGNLRNARPIAKLWKSLRVGVYMPLQKASTPSGMIDSHLPAFKSQ